MSEIAKFKDKVMDKFGRHLTDAVFLMIQNDRELMQEYIELLNSNHKPQAINSRIGKAVKEKYSLTNDERNEHPISTLIKSHQIFE